MRFSLFCIATILPFLVANAHQVNHDYQSTGGSTHDYSFDHEAFLGKDQMQQFAELTEDQSKQQLAKMLPKIDSDKNGTITLGELATHIRKIQRSFVDRDVRRMWGYFPVGSDGFLPWSMYMKTTYGTEDPKKITHPDYVKMFKTFSKRWKVADLDHDDKLTLEEYICLIHPEEIEECFHMKSVVLENNFQAMDTNNDGHVEFDEYIKDTYKVDPEDFKNKEEPGWITYERDIFLKNRDKDGDGKLNMHEVQKWVSPDGYDPAEAEANHLISMADKDNDGKLSYEEVLDSHTKFVNSQATHHGEQLKKHDPSEF